MIQQDPKKTSYTFGGTANTPALDEAFDDVGDVRPAYTEIIDSLLALDLLEVTEQAQSYLAREGVEFHTAAGGTRPFTVDPVPRIIPAAEWGELAAGVTQRVEALNRFVVDAYGDQAIVEAGIVPRRAIEEAIYFEPDLVGLEPPSGGVFTHISGLDLVRGADGTMLVLEDNVRSPSGLTFALAARRMIDNTLPFAIDHPKRDISGILDLLAATLRAAAPVADREPSIVLLTDGPTSAAWYEHQMIADALGIALVTPGQLERHRGSIFARIGRSLQPVDVIYRRTELDLLRAKNGDLTLFGELLLEPIRKGQVACVNGFGAGVADDKLIHGYVEEMIHFYLNQQPLLQSVRTYDLSAPASRAIALDRLNELVVKPRSGLGGDSVSIGHLASAKELRATADLIAREPQNWIAQETVSLSTHPTVVKDSIEPRHIDLRPYAFCSQDGVKVSGGCLTRVALERGSLIVNSSRNGGAKDTWICD